MDNTADTFFKYYGIGVLICAIQVLIHQGVNANEIDFLKELFLTFMYVNCVGIWMALAKLLQNGIYRIIKKNLKNEIHWGDSRVTCGRDNGRVVAC